MASSSHFTPGTSSSRSYKYDVFLSFRGADTRKTFVDHLYSSLKQHLIEVYKDDQTLRRGDSIDQSLYEAIEESQIAVIIFSKNYADSSWCLEELAHITRCKDERGLIVLPIFYDVKPSDVRNQKRKFGEAFAKQEANDITKAEIWRKTLFNVGSIAGWESKNIADGHESQFIKNIVDTILDRLFALNSFVDEDLVGMRARVHDLESLLDIGSEGVRMVGIWGVGGGGKSTLATSVYMKISQHFQGQCIVENVREGTRKYGLNKLQENILSVLFKSGVNVHSVMEGKTMMKNMLCRRKVLVLLDDVDKLDQLEVLAGKHNWFGSGSRIIITTRDEHLLRTHKVDHIYPIKLLSHDEAIQLFKKHSYNEEDPVEDYATLSLRAVSYASGLPLSLKVLGSFLYDKNKNEWISALKKLKDIPNQEVMNILKISYDGLETSEKELFLDIACFFRESLETSSYDDAMEMLEACGFHPEIGIKVLRQKALITITNYEYGVRFDMHDLVQEMGHYIVRGEHPNNPEKHTRVWKHEEIEEMCFGNATMENDTIEAIKYRREHSVPFCKLVSNMKKLRTLIVRAKYGSKDEDEGPKFLSNELRYIYWYKYPTRSPFPNAFQPMKLVVLTLFDNKQKELWKGNKHFPHLKVLRLSLMRELLSTPDFSGLPRLQKLILDSCYKLEEIHSSLENHTGLEYLDVSHCEELRSIPTISQMKKMKNLVIRICSLKDGEIPPGIGELSNLEELVLSWNNFSRLDFGLSQLTRLKSLNLSGCDKLLELPELPSSLNSLTINHCKSLTTIDGGFTKNYEHLHQVAIDGRNELGKRLLQQMLKGRAIANGTMHFFVDNLEIAKEFTPPLLRGESGYKLELPENWRNDFSGFLICVVYSSSCYELPPRYVVVSMKQVSGMDFNDDVVWEETDRGGDRDMYTSVWYVSFGSLRHTVWWDQTYNELSFELENPRCKGFGVRLVEKESRKGLTETSSTDSSSHYTPKINILDDSTSELRIHLRRYQSP